MMKDNACNHRQRGRSLNRLAGEDYQQRRQHRSLNSQSVPTRNPMITVLPPTAQTPRHRPVATCDARPPEKHRGGFRQRRKMKQGGLFQSMFTSFVACNELMYDRCDECGDDGISYTYGNVSKNSVTMATEEEEDSNTIEESTLDNSTILSDTLQADWETIATGPIYRDLNEAKSDIAHGALSAEKDWYRLSQIGDDAPRDLLPPGSMIYIREYTISTSLGQVRQTDHANNKDRTASAKGSLRKDEYYIDSPVSRSRLVSGNSREQKLLSAPLKYRSKSGDRTTMLHSQSRSLTRPRSLSRRPSQKQAPTGTSSIPRQVRGRSVSARKKRTGRFISSSRESQPALKIGPRIESNQRRGSASSSKESHADRGRERSKQSANKYSDKLSKSSSKRSARKRNIARARQSLASGRSASRNSKLYVQKETEKRFVMSRLRGYSPGWHRKSERIRVCDSLRMVDTSVRQRSANAERQLNELVKSENESEIAIYSQSSPVATESMDRKSSSMMNVPDPLQQNNRELKIQTGGNKSFVKGGFFSWRKIKGRSGRHMAKDLVQSFHIPPPSVSEDAPTPNADEFETAGLAFPVPHEEGQEIAIQDNEHCYEDPASVHSMLTIPSLDLHSRHKEEANHDSENDRNLVVVLTGNEDGTLITDDGAI